MLRQALNAANQLIFGSEEDELKNFLATSEDLKQMRKCAPYGSTYTSVSSGIETKHNQNLEMLTDIEKARTFADILQVTKRCDFVNSKEPLAKKIGPRGLNALSYVGGFFNNDVNFVYYAARFRETAHKIALDKGYRTKIDSELKRGSLRT